MLTVGAVSKTPVIGSVPGAFETTTSADWGEPIRVRLVTDEDASIPFLGTWAIPLSSEFVTRSEVTH